MAAATKTVIGTGFIGLEVAASSMSESLERVKGRELGNIARRMIPLLFV
jgi:hypothetical protein